VIRPATDPGQFALAAIGAAFGAAAALRNGRVWLVAVRIVSERWEADRGQHNLALPDRLQTPLDA
jgi:hypothetical protein